MQHLWVREDALQARDTSQCNLVLATRRNADVEDVSDTYAVLVGADLAVMMAGCVLLCSTFG